MKAWLVPTRVGMIPATIATGNISPPCPHTRGDDPRRIVRIGSVPYLSPHAWG